MMEYKVIAGTLLSLFLLGMLPITLHVQPVKAEPGTIYIRADGSIEPSTANVTSVDSVTYTFTGNIVGDVPYGQSAIVVERDSIVIDGAGYTLHGSSGLYSIGINLTGRSNITIRNMKIELFFWGIWLYGSSNNSISGNNITKNNEYGINLDSSNYNTISENNVTNHGHGMRLFGSLYNSISGNNIKNNGYGIGLPSSSNNSIYGNNVANNDYLGIWFSSSSNNIISGNNIESNGDGIYSESSNNNKFYHNNFINNAQQANCYASVNAWDDDYPSGGNYWSDHSSLDLHSGLYQNETGSDGIGDIAYVIDADNQDHYPLMRPWPNPLVIPIKGGENATVESNVTLTKAVVTKNTLHFEASGSSGSTGWINVTFPMINTTEIKVFINGTKMTPPPFPIITTNGTHYFIYFEFTLSTDIATIQFWLLGDITGPEGELDGIVDALDLAVMANAYGSQQGEPNWESGYDLTSAQYLVSDQKIDIRDLFVMARSFGGAGL